MELSIPSILLQIFHIYTILCLLLCFCTDCYFLSKSTDWAIRTGIKHEYIMSNIRFYINMGVLGWLLLAVFFTVVEILTMLDIKFLESVSNTIVKPIVILLMGFCILGICGDLGIASGILTLIAGAIWLVLDIILMI